MTTPIDMILYCPNCGLQHIDAPDEPDKYCITEADGSCISTDPRCMHQLNPEPRWENPPHRSHLCADPECGCVWRPSDTETNGVADIQTEGKDDTWPVYAGEVTAQPAQRRKGGKTGSPPGMLQDDHRPLSKALAAMPGAAYQARIAARDIAKQKATTEVLQSIAGALELAQTGLQWFRDMYPQHHKGDDDEADEEIAKALRQIEQFEAVVKQVYETGSRALFQMEMDRWHWNSIQSTDDKRKAYKELQAAISAIKEFS